MKYDNDKTAAQILKSGGIGVIPTDTIYGMVGRAMNMKTIERMYEVRHRDPDKPFIILISDINDLRMFNIEPDKKTEELLQKFWPGKVSIILSCPSEKFHYLHRGKKSLAFRLPDKEDLIDLIRQVGPLAAPSANTGGLAPAKTIEEAKKYFGADVDFYIEGGPLDSQPSKLIALKKGEVKVIRG